MEVYQGVAMTDGLNRKNHFIPLSTILKAYRDTWDRTIPMNIGHDRTKPIGYTRLTGVYMEPGKAYVTNEGAIMETTEEHEMLRKMIEVNDYQQFCEAHRDEIDSLVGKLKDVITDSFRVAPIGQAVAIKDNDIVKRLFPEWINNFKDGLTDINELESVYSTTTDGEKGVLIPGVYFKDGYLLFAHQFFRRTLSILNSTNEEFFVSFEKLRDIPNLNVKVALDMDMVGLPGTEHPEIEYQYIRGPYFSEDLKLIPEGVTCYENEHYDNLFSNIVGTQFYWHKQDGTRTFECEELCDRENVSFDGGNTMLWGCRYVHSMLNPSTGLPTHLDGAIRLYNEENILERIDKKNDISKCGKNSKYIKLWRIDNDFSVSLWKELISSFYRENSLIGQYFGGIDEKYEQIKKEEETLVLRIAERRKDLFLSSAIAKKVIKLSQKVVPGATKSPLSEKDWQNIITQVNEVYPFLADRLAAFNLSAAELRYCYLSLLGLDSIGESILLHIQPDSVNKRRQRVRQRLGIIAKELDLCAYLINSVQ